MPFRLFESILNLVRAVSRIRAAVLENADLVLRSVLYAASLTKVFAVKVSEGRSGGMAG